MIKNRVKSLIVNNYFKKWGKKITLKSNSSGHWIFSCHYSSLQCHM